MTSVITPYLTLCQCIKPSPHLEHNDVEVGVFHAADQDGDQPVEVGRERLLADGLLGKGEPELAGLDGDRLVRVLGPQQHVLQAGG